MENKKRSDMVLSLVLLAALFGLIAVLELVVPPTHILFTVLKKSAVYALVAVSMNLLNGFTGLFSLGQAGFMLLGAYAYAIFTIPNAQRETVYQYYDNGGLIHLSLTETFGPIIGIILALLLAGIVAAIFAWLIGLPVLRLKSDYLAIATLGFAEILKAVCQTNWMGPITNGSNLLRKYPYFKSTLMYFVVAAICIAIIVLLIHSTYGRAFQAIRDDEVAAEAMGINLAKHKQMAFIISSFFAGISGALLAMYQTTVQATPFTTTMTYEILLIVVIGGIGSITGSCISSFLFIACSEWWLRGLDAGTFLGISAPFFRQGLRKVVFAVIIMLIVLFRREGLMGTHEFSVAGIRKWFRSLGKKKAKEAA